MVKSHLILDIHLSTSIDQQRYDINVTMSANAKQRGFSKLETEMRLLLKQHHLILDIHISTSIEQQRYNINVTIITSEIQRCVSILEKEIPVSQQ